MSDHAVFLLHVLKWLPSADKIKSLNVHPLTRFSMVQSLLTQASTCNSSPNSLPPWSWHKPGELLIWAIALVQSPDTDVLGPWTQCLLSFFLLISHLCSNFISSESFFTCLTHIYTHHPHLYPLTLLYWCIFVACKHVWHAIYWVVYLFVCLPPVNVRSKEKRVFFSSSHCFWTVFAYGGLINIFWINKSSWCWGFRNTNATNYTSSKTAFGRRFQILYN